MTCDVLGVGQEHLAQLNAAQDDQMGSKVVVYWIEM